MVKNGKWNDKAVEDDRFGKVKDRFYDTPLVTIAPDSAKETADFARNMKKLAACFEKITPAEK